MENLVPKEAYEMDAGGYRKRIGLLTGIVFGLAMGITWFILTPSIAGTDQRALPSICAGAFCGVTFGYIRVTACHAVGSALRILLLAESYTSVHFGSYSFLITWTCLATDPVSRWGRLEISNSLWVHKSRIYSTDCWFLGRCRYFKSLGHEEAQIF